MDGILDFLFGPWTMILLGAAVLAGTAVLVPMAVILTLRMIESGIAKTRDVMRAGLALLRTRLRSGTPAASPSSLRRGMD